MADETVVFFHAHPDDEAIFTGGSMYLLSRSGARVVLVVATSGERGEVRAELADGESVAERRASETDAAAEILGISRVVHLDYRDSGMVGDPANDAPGSFAVADMEEATGKVAAVLREEEATSLVAYDAGGIYGHPDHVQVHRVGIAAARSAGVETVYQATVDREYLHFVETHLVDEASAAALPMPTVGVPTVFVTTTVDVREVLDVKRRAIAVHASQIPETSTAMSMAPDAFSGVYGFEWYVREGASGPLEAL